MGSRCHKSLSYPVAPRTVSFFFLSKYLEVWLQLIWGWTLFSAIGDWGKLDVDSPGLSDAQRQPSHRAPRVTPSTIQGHCSRLLLLNPPTPRGRIREHEVDIRWREGSCLFCHLPLQFPPGLVLEVRTSCWAVCGGLRFTRCLCPRTVMRWEQSPVTGISVRCVVTFPWWKKALILMPELSCFIKISLLFSGKPFMMLLLSGSNGHFLAFCLWAQVEVVQAGHGA